MISLLLSATVFVLYLLGAVLMREYVDFMEEKEDDYLPRPGPYWKFILTWPYQIAVGLFAKDTND